MYETCVFSWLVSKRDEMSRDQKWRKKYSLQTEMKKTL